MPQKRRTYKKKSKSARSRKYRGGENNPEPKLPPPNNTNQETIADNAVELNQLLKNAEPNNLAEVVNLNQPPKPEVTEVVGEVSEDDNWKIITKADPEFQTAIADAPYLKKIQPLIENYHFQYLLKVLRNFSYANSHKAYIDASQTAWCYVFVVSQLVEWLNREIQNIQTTKESQDYAFTAKDGTIIIAELEKYKRYFEANNTGWDRLNTQYLEVLFDDIHE